MNRKQLLAFARANGYTGTADLASIKKFVADQLAEGIELKFFESDGTTPVDIDAAWAKLDTKAVTTAVVTDTADDDDQPLTITGKDAAEYRKSVKARTEANRGSGFKDVGHVNGRDNNIVNYAMTFEVKSYNLKAARGATYYGDAEEAMLVGAWAKLAAVPPGMDFEGKGTCVEICRKANVSYDFSSGGFAIPSVLRNALIRIRPRYSAIQQLLGIIPIAPSGESVPRRTGGVTVYSPGEGVAATESNAAGDQVKLTPFEMVALSTVSKTQLMRSLIDFGEFVTNEMVYAIDKKLEEIYVKGDGSSTYFNQTGLLGKLSKQVTDAAGTWTIGTNATNAEYHSGCVRGSGNLWSELSFTDFTNVIGRVALVENPMALSWLCSWNFFQQVMVNIAAGRTTVGGTGGTTQAQVLNGDGVSMTVPVFMGYRVIFSNAMPLTQANGQVCAHFGDFDMVTKVGDVPNSMEMETNPHRYWDQRKIGYQVSTFKAVNCHDLGTANATQPDQTVPYSFLVTAES